MRDTLFTRVETNEYPSGLRNRGFSERWLLFFLGLSGCFHSFFHIFYTIYKAGFDFHLF